MATWVRRLLGYREIKVITSVDVHEVVLGHGIRGRITGSHMEWQRVRPWWAIWRRWP